MTNFRRKAEPVEAWQLKNAPVPQWVVGEMLAGRVRQGPPKDAEPQSRSRRGFWLSDGLVVDSGEDEVRVAVLGWIVKDAEGNLAGYSEMDFMERFEACDRAEAFK